MSEWRAAQLNDIIEEIIDRRGVTPTKLGSSFKPAGHRVISAKNIKQHRIDLSCDEARFIDSQTYQKWMKTPLVKDDVILTSEAPLGEVAYCHSATSYVLGQRLFGLRTKKEVMSGRFLYYLLQSPEYQHQLRSRMTGTTAEGIRQSELRLLSLTFPPLDEQLAIASILGTLDDKINLNRQMNKSLESFARAIFKSWFIDFDPVRAKAEGKQPFGMDEETAALFPSEFEDSELGEIPRGWAIKTIGEMCDVVGGSTPSTKEPSYWGNDHFFVTPKDMSSLKSPFILSSERQITNEGLKRISSGLLPVGTVLLSSRAPIGYLAIAEVPVSVNQGIIAMIPNGKLPSSYLLFWTEASMDAILCNANGSTFQEISKSNFRPISMVVPPKEIVSRFNAFVEPLLVRVVNNMKESLTLAALRDTLLPKLLSGEIRVPVEAD